MKLMNIDRLKPLSGEVAIIQGLEREANVPFLRGSSPLAEIKAFWCRGL
jgi:hypothetical protein